MLYCVFSENAISSPVITMHSDNTSTCNQKKSAAELRARLVKCKSMPDRESPPHLDNAAYKHGSQDDLPGKYASNDLLHVAIQLNSAFWKCWTLELCFGHGNPGLGLHLLS